MVTLRALMTSEKPLILPSVYDGISALAFREHAFRAAYIGSHGTGATKYGLPDTGFIGLEDMADQIRRLGPIVGVPLVVDGEGGWGNPVHVARSVRILEQAGASAAHLEDHEFGKHVTAKPHVISMAAAVDKIKAALDARSSDDFLVIARTDASKSLGGSAAVERMLAYQEAGADAVFVSGVLGSEDWRTVRAECTVPVMTPNLPGRSAGELVRLGASVVVYYGMAHACAMPAISAAFAHLASHPVDEPIDRDWDTVAALTRLDTFLGVEDVRAQAEAYGLIG